MSRFKSIEVFEKVSAFCTLLPVYEHRNFTDDGARAKDFANSSSIPKAHRGRGRMDHFSKTEVQQRMKFSFKISYCRIFFNFPQSRLVFTSSCHLCDQQQGWALLGCWEFHLLNSKCHYFTFPSQASWFMNSTKASGLSWYWTLR